MIIKIKKRNAIKELKYYKSAGKKLLKKIKKRRQNDQSYSKLEKGVQNWYNNLCKSLHFIFLAANHIEMNIIFPITGVNFSKKEYIDAIEKVLCEIDIKIKILNDIIPPKKPNSNFIRNLLTFALTLLAPILFFIIVIRDVHINNLKTEIKELKDIKESIDVDKTLLESRLNKLIESLNLILSKPKNNELLKLKKGKSIKILGGRVSLSLKKMTTKKGKVRVELTNALFDESLRTVEVIGIYENKFFTFMKKKYYVYVIEIKQDSVLIFMGEQI
jgi:hypothetical protein